jgi:hypothetical protein
MIAGRVNVAPVARRHLERAPPPSPGPRPSWRGRGTQGQPPRQDATACQAGLYQGTVRHYTYRDKAFVTGQTRLREGRDY